MATKELTIKDWQLGIGQSPYLGFAQMTNVDIFTQPGSLKISNLLELDNIDAINITAMPIGITQSPLNGDIFIVCEDGKFFKRDGTNTWTEIVGYGAGGRGGQGIVWWKGYIIYARGSALDAYNVTTGVWTVNWRTGLNSAVHPMIVLQDDRLYIGNGNFIDLCGEVFGQTFDPTNGATYSYSSEALPLKQGYIVNLLEEFSSYLVIGTKQYNNNVADMFFWNGSDEFITASQTIKFADNGVQMTKNVGNMLYTIAGTGVPRIFRSLTSQAVEYLRFNNINKGSASVTLYPQAIDQKDGEILFGIGQNLSVNGVTPVGVYSLRGSSYVLRYLPSSGKDGSNGVSYIGFVKVIDAERMLVSWYDGTTYGIDILNISKFYPTGASVESPIYTVGTESDPKTYERVEVRLGNPLKAGDIITIKGRKNLTDSYVTLATFGASYVGRDAVEERVLNLSKLVEFQCKIELETSSSATESIEIKEVIFY